MNPGWRLLIVVAIVVLTMCVGCGVLGSPDACDRGEVAVDALERATLKHCSDVTGNDLSKRVSKKGLIRMGG